MYFDINGAPAKYFYLTDLSNGAKGPVYAKRSNGFNPFYFNEDDAAGYGKVTTSPSSGADYGYKITNPTSGDWMEVSFSEVQIMMRLSWLLGKVMSYNFCYE